MLKLLPGNLYIFAIYFYNVLAYIWPQCSISKIQLSEEEGASFQQPQGGMQTGFFSGQHSILGLQTERGVDLQPEQ